MSMLPAMSECTCRRHAVCPLHLGLVPHVLERWSVADLWWTPTPQVTYYRVVLRDGQRMTERNHALTPTTWEAVPDA